LASSVKEDAAGTAIQLGSRVLKVHANDSVAVAGKGRTRLTSAALAGKVTVARQQPATMQPPTTTAY
jgi:hypothetical protein